MTDTAGADDPIDALRAASAALDDPDAAAAGPDVVDEDPMEQADRFDALHEALVAVLADTVDPADRP